MGYVFISYSTQNQHYADMFRSFFIDSGVNVWMAPYDIPVGSRYAQVINQAIKECSCLVLLLSNAAQESTWVCKEVERAINYKKVIIPVQLEPVVLNDEFEFYISTDQVVRITPDGDNSALLKDVLASVKVCVGCDESLEQNDISDENGSNEPVSNIITLTDENGNDVEFEFLDLIEHKGKEYVVLFPVVDEDSEVVILEVQTADGDTENYVNVEDDGILNEVFAIFREKFKDVFNFTN